MDASTIKQYIAKGQLKRAVDAFANWLGTPEALSFQRLLAEKEQNYLLGLLPADQLDHARNKISIGVLQALAHLDKGQQGAPRSQLAVDLFLLAQKAQQNGRTAQAIQFLTRCIDSAPDFTEAYIERGVARCSLKEPDPAGALEDYALALAQVPGHPLALLNRGIAYARYLEDIPAAVSDWEAAAEQGLEIARHYIGQYKPYL